MATFKLIGTIDLGEIEKLDPAQALKVAVKRHCQVIRSEVVTLAQAQKQIEFKLSFEADSEEPIGVDVVVGPDVPDEQLQSVETAKVRVPARAFERGRAKVELAIPDRLYRWWLGFCRTHTIRGRVVCRQLRYDPIEQQWIPCESPVRGALVTAYDVDSIWWWCRTDSVGSDYTDLNGNFEIKFRWCCWRWAPWLFKNWRLDPYVVRRIKDLSEAASPVIPLPPPTPELDLKIFEAIAAEADALRDDAPGTVSSLANPQPLLGLGQQLAARLPAAPDLRELRIWPWWPHWDCHPDVVFKVTQDCGEGDVVIVEENCGDTRWNVPQELSGVTLVANEKACCAPCCSQPPDGDCLVFQGVGCGAYPLVQIEQDKVSNLVGYGYPGSQDRPFGRTIRLRGVFGDGSPADFYKLQRRRFLPATASWTTWQDIPTDELASFDRWHWLGFPPPLRLKQTVAPEVVDSETVLKTTHRFRAEHPEIVETVDPDADDWLALWLTARVQTVANGNTEETPLVADGLYELRVVGYDFDAATERLVNSRVMPLCAAEGEAVDPAAHAMMRLRIDNRSAVSEPGTVHVDTVEPACDYPNVCAVVKNEGRRDEECVSVCDVVSVVAGDTLTVYFQASDIDGHLERYTLNAHWGESEVFNLLGVGAIASNPDALFGPTYASTFVGDQGLHRAGLPATDPERGRPFWKGGHFKVTVAVGNPVPGTGHRAFEDCCAYLLRLRVWKRTTNGCTASRHFHVNWSEFSFTVVRADLPCAEGLLDAALEGGAEL